ncbi:MAG TPA: TonB-dependent receptor [Steroidobacteraceae bacterium]|nr:TonB-dependent receptor [Steroidobacteraceae bacterium]
MLSRRIGSSAAIIAVTMGGAVTLGTAQRASAAEEGAAAEGPRGLITEVVVTARKRGDERLQEIPTAISAFSEQALQDMGVNEFTDFAYQVPGLTFNDTGNGEKRYIMRGVQSAGQEQVAVYYDEVPATGVQSSSGDSGSQTPDLSLVDLERIEVLKGPQGTTFGANSQTGVVRFIVNKPVLDAVEGSFRVGGEALEDGDPGASASATFNLPLIDNELALRTSAYYEKRGGYVDNVRLGNDNINSSQTTGGRVMLRYQPTDAATIDAMVWLQKRDVDGASGYHPYDSFHVSGTQDAAARDRIPAFAFFDTGTFHNGDYVETRRPDDQQIYSLTWTQDLSWATLTAAGSVYKRDFGFFRDNTWAVISLNVGPPGATVCFSGPCVRPDLFPELTDQTQDMNQRTGEVRLNSSGDGPLSWLAGVFWRDRESDFRSVSPIVDPATGLPFPVTGPPTGFSSAPGAGIEGCQPCALARFNTRDIEESAVFGELSYELFDSFEVMAGLRQFTAEQSDRGFYLFQFPLFGGLPPPDNRHFKEDRLIKKFQLSYRPSRDVTIFALASEGFRLGGTNQPNIAAVPPGYEADSLWNYELGVKSAWLDGRLIVNSSAFLIDWDNIQVSGRDPTGSFAFIGNAGAAEVQGLELETFFQPVRSVSLTAGLSWLPKRELVEDQVNATVQAPGRKGDNLPRIPEITANFSVQYERSLSALPSWSAWIRGDWSYHGKSHTELRPTAATDRLQEDYDITNIRLGARKEDSGLDVALYVNNVFDIQGDVFLVGATATPTVKYTNMPRTIGVELSKRF